MCHSEHTFRIWPDGVPDGSTASEELALMAAPHAMGPADGVTAGVHNGAHFYTVGQRKGLNLGGYREPLFVIATDTPEQSRICG
ncbi:MAG: tRNA methyl transferase PRC-barrel domain-containing protein [Bacteroidales bacterium]|nr:tRNA methyl transferase PRC-barrel domain-containing protein [Bacteroidales bacterium]